MANILARLRDQIINGAADRLVDATDSNAQDMIRRYCKNHDIPATTRDIADMATEAIRRRMAAEIKVNRGYIDQLNNKVNSYHP